MLQFQSPCKYRAHVANTCVHKQVSRKISWLCLFWCQVLQWSEPVSFLYEIILRPFGPTPYGLTDIASPSSRHPAVSQCLGPGLFTTQVSLPCRDERGELNSQAPWTGHLSPGQPWYRLCGVLLLEFSPSEERDMSSHWYQGIQSYHLGDKTLFFFVLPPLGLLEKGKNVDIPHTKGNHLGLA